MKGKSKEEVEITKDKQILTGVTIPKIFKLRFDVWLNDGDRLGANDVANIILVRNTGRETSDDYQTGARIPGIWVKGNPPKMYVWYYGETKYICGHCDDTQYDAEVDIKYGEWNTIEVRQVKQNDNYVFEILFNCELIHSWIIKEPRIFENSVISFLKSRALSKSVRLLYKLAYKRPLFVFRTILFA